MPLKIFPPRSGKTPNHSIRGTYLGVYVDRTAGTPEIAKARKVRRKIQSEIERGRFATKGEPTFAIAALAYLQNGGEDRFISPLAEHFGETRLSEIDQAAIDGAAHKLYPDSTPATRNRQVYTPVSAILKHVGVEFELKRPKGAGGQQRVDWLWPEQAFATFEAAGGMDPELEAFLIALCYTGMRLGESTVLMLCENVRLADGFAYVPYTKNGDPRPVYLPPVLVAALANHPRGLDRGDQTVFKFRKGGHLYRLLAEVNRRTGLDWVTFHTFRHTYGTWMRRYGGLDTKGLVDTGTWRSEKAASRYAHTVASEEAQRANVLPTKRLLK